MKRSKIFISHFGRISLLLLIYIFFSQIISTKLFAQEEKIATIQLSFDQNDTMRFCIAQVTSDNNPVSEIEVHFYVKRFYSLLPIGKAIETDSNGIAIANFPLDLPGDKNGQIIAVAKIEEDDNYGTVESSSEVKWGIIPAIEKEGLSNRSLSASRDKAPMILILVSNLIIGIIWGTIFYIIYLVFKIRKESQMLKTKHK